MSDSAFVDGSTHFKEFYGKLNVISEIISKKKTPITNTRTTFDTIFGNANKSNPKPHDETDTLKVILNKQHDSTVLIETFDYPKQKETEGTDYITKKFDAGNFQDQNERSTVKIKFDVEVTPLQNWFSHDLVSIFNINEENTKPNIKELYSTPSEYTANIKQLFTFKTVHNITNAQYVWESKYNMLALFNQPFLLLTFDMYYYNIMNEPLFKNNFDIKEDTTAAGATAVSTVVAGSAVAGSVAAGAAGSAVAGPAAAVSAATGSVAAGAAGSAATGSVAAGSAATAATATKLLSVESLLNIDTFYGKLPTFLMLLIYYAGYRFNIKVEDITSKFRNKFNQSTNGKSFDIKLYAPIPDKIETKYNNLLRSQIQPTSVDLTYETLEVYHVGSEVKSLWDYVNGKLTILINNMLNSKDKDDKNRYKALFKKPYTSNSLFLFECIDALKKYKEYILNPANITTIAFPMSTLKTLEILILKLSYILSVLEPTFIPIETMSFDVIMNGKTLKYVINSELQATNISIDDYISNDKLMSAILSTRAASIEKDDKGITKAKNLLSDSTALELQKSVIQKQADLYHRNYLEKNIAYQRIYSEFVKSDANLTKLTKEHKTAGWDDDTLNNNVTYMNHVVQHAELDLAAEIANAEKLDYQDKDTKWTQLLKALDDGTDTTAAYDAFSADSTIDNKGITHATTRLTAKKQLLAEATKLPPEQQEQIEVAVARTQLLRENLATKSNSTTGAIASVGGDIPVQITVTDDHIKNGRRFGLSFGTLDSASTSQFILGKIVNKSTHGWPKDFTTKNITTGYMLNKIELAKSGNTRDVVWDVSKPVEQNYADVIKAEERTLLNRFKNDEIKKKIIAFKHFLNILDGLDVNNKYIFYFLKPDATVSSTVDPFSGGKNTTKKVNRKQRQIQSKKKKVFESEAK